MFHFFLITYKILYMEYFSPDYAMKLEKSMPQRSMRLLIVSKSNTNDKLNVIIVGLDSVSRLNFHRQMPQTLDFLLNELGAIEYFGYNKVGDNTFPNLVPALSGMNETELVSKCWHTNKDYFDTCELLWSKYNQSGYATAFAEEAAWMGLFNYQKKGFIKQPVTHMWGILDKIAEEEIGYKGGNSRICLGVKPTIEYLLEYALKFVRSYKKANQNFFGLFWESSFSHDYLNYDPKIDIIYRNFLEDLSGTQALEDSILFFMSDHGIRWGGILNTYQGRLEERLPYMFIVAPKSLQEKYPGIRKNLEDNARKLTSHFDLYETLKAIVEQNYSSDPIIPERGISLFRPVPNERTCESAGIPAHWCTCQESVQLDTTNATVKKVVDVTIRYINNLLSNHTYCAKLILDTIIDASVSHAINFTNSHMKEPLSYYTVVFQTKFVGAVFEATVKCSKCDLLSDFVMAGPVSRHNTYGHQGDCIADAKLRLYCYCKT